MNFSIEKKGYSVYEVDAYVEDIEAKYQNLQAQNAELEQKLATAKRLIRRFSDTENALKQNIADSKRAAAYMISDARDRSALLLDSARESCGEIISDLDMQIAERMQTVNYMKTQVSAFKDELFALYSAHIELIDKLAGCAEDFEYVPDYSAVADAVDAFEEAEEPDSTVPEFVEYPEESIFSELEEDEQEADEGFVLAQQEKSEEDDIVFVTEAGLEESGEEEDFSQLELDEGEDEESLENEFEMAFFEEDSKEPEPLEHPVNFVNDVSEDEENGEKEGDAEEEGTEPDYFKFLSDFANSDEGSGN